MFFRKNSGNLFTLSFDFSRYDIWFLLKFTSFLFRRKANSTIEQWKCEGHRKWNLIFRFASENKVFPVYPVFSYWVNFTKNEPMINCSWIWKIFKGIFFFKFENWSFLWKSVVFSSFSLRWLLFWNCQLAMFKSNERSEDYYIGFADFFVFFSWKSENIDALSYNVLFEFNWN